MLSRITLVTGLLACLALTALAPAQASDRRFYPSDEPHHAAHRAEQYAEYREPRPVYRPYYDRPAPGYYNPPRYRDDRYREAYRPHYHRHHHHDDYYYRDRRW